VEEIPRTLLEHVSNSARFIVERWWVKLADRERQEVVELCDVEREECFFGPAASGEEQPIVVGGHFLPHDDAWRLEDWVDEWREYLVEHKELFLTTQFVSWRLDVGRGPFGESGYSVDCWADWSRTLFRNDELPPSQRLEECGAAPAPDVVIIRVTRL
jgi:hypothetical protein